MAVLNLYGSSKKPRNVRPPWPFWTSHILSKKLEPAPYKKIILELELYF
jgi:hypothetical protein